MQKRLKAFTLIELIVVITILSIITLMSYTPYAHHQKKLLVKQAAREISQSLSEARNLAVHGIDTGSWNLDVALYFWALAGELEYYVSTGSIDLVNKSSSTLYKTKRLPPGIQVDMIDGWEQEYMLNFSAITWDISIDPTIVNSAFDIQISYKWASSLVLQKIIRYYTQSYISDY